MPFAACYWPIATDRPVLAACRLGLGRARPIKQGRWEVMVYRCSVCLAWAPGSGRLPLFFELILPPVVIPTTSAANMYYSLRHHPGFLRAQMALHILRTKCVMRATVLETDAAYSNDKLIAFFMGRATAGPNDSIVWKACHSHRNMHIETMTLAVIGMKLVVQLFNVCCFRNSGSHFHRLRLSAEAWADDASERFVLGGSPPASARRLAQCIVGYYQNAGALITQRSSARSQRWRHGFGRDPTARAQAAQTRHAEYVASLETFLTNTYNALGPGDTIHYCVGPSCCSDGRSSLAGRLVEGLRNLLLRRKPNPPVASKWTKLVPALNIVMLGVLLRCWLPLWRFAFAALAVTASKVLPRKQKRDEDDVDDDDLLDKGLTFAALSGARFRKASKFLECESQNVSLMILAASLEPARLLTDFFIRCSSDVRDRNARPAMVVLLSKRHSPLYLCIQYLSFLLFEQPVEGSRNLMVALWLGYGSGQAHAEGILGGVQSRQHCIVEWPGAGTRTHRLRADWTTGAPFLQDLR